MKTKRGNQYVAKIIDQGIRHAGEAILAMTRASVRIPLPPAGGVEGSSSEGPKHPIDQSEFGETQPATFFISAEETMAHA